MKILLIFLVVVFLGVGCGKTDENDNKLVDCYDINGGGWHTPDLTQKECEEKQQKSREYYEEKKVKAKEKGCRYPDNWNCDVGNKKYYYNLDSIGEFQWIETDDSKACSKYAEKTVSELPIKCLEYFDIKKRAD